MTRSRIAIATNGHLCRNPRVLKEATSLAQAGHDVVVVGVRNHRPSVALDAELLRDAPFCHTAIELLPGGGASAFRTRLLQRLAREAATRFGLSSIHALGPAAALLARLRVQPTDLFIVHNEIAHWAGARLLMLGRRVAADIEDWHSEDLLPEDRRGRPLALLRHIERQLLHRAVYATTTSHAMAGALHARYGGKKPAVLTNSFPLSPQSSASLPRSSIPRFFWFSQTTGPGRGLEPFLDVWARTTQPSHLILLGEVRGGYDRELLSRLPLDRRDRVTFLPPVPPLALPALIAQHDIGLALEQPSIVNRDLTITNKILQYLGAGLAVVATPTAGQREVLAQAPDAGVELDFTSPARDAAVLDQLLADRAQLSLRQHAARRLAESRYCWEHETPRLLALVSAALNAPLSPVPVSP